MRCFADQLACSFVRSFKSLVSFPLILGFSALITSHAIAKPIEQQRQDYLAAKNALDKKQFKTFGQIANGLKDYPLHSYLRYEYIRKQLWKMKDDEMIDFFKQHPDLPMTESLRTSWLKLLVKRQHWQTFIDNYVPQQNDTLRCDYLLARMQLNQHDYLLEDIRTVWLTGKSLPAECDKPFALLSTTALMTNELVWERIKLAMQNNQVSLAKYLSNKLDSYYKTLADSWLNIHYQPDKFTRKPTLADDETGREILMYGIMRLAKQNLELAHQRVDALANHYSFLPSEVAELRRMIAVSAAKRKSPIAEDLLDAVDNYYVDNEVFHYRLRIALDNLDWPLLRRWTTNKPADVDIHNRWSYWHARALENTMDQINAKKIYEELSKKRDYYGFLAADKLGKPYSMEHYPLPVNEEIMQSVAKLPAMQRAHELYMVNDSYPARREWYHALKSMTSYQMQLAAKLAIKWGWHDRAIFTMGRAKAFDDLEVRFPIIFDKLLDKYANNRNIDSSWVYGLVRAESAFIEDARSPAGALGLMQVMPATGKSTARKIGLKNFTADKLKKAEVNIPIGTAYMKLMLDRFNGNMVLATAAYNAGPNQVDKWLPDQGCAEPDIWIEQIPFKETRKYVSRVLTYANIYDFRLKKDITPLSKRMALITKKVKNSSITSKLSCTAQISDNRNVH